MTNNKRTIAILSITSILIFSGFGYSPFAYSTGSWSGHDKDDRDDDWKEWKDWKKWKENKKHQENDIESGLCNSLDNLIENGCFESPDVDTEADWDIYDTSEIPHWEVSWIDSENACSGQYSELPGQIELQEGILGGPAEGTQHAELDSDCNGPEGPSDGEEQTNVEISQTVSTSSTDEYEITFAYKARPSKKVPLTSNGLTVEWDGAEVPLDLKFSKKKWKYASAIVDGNPEGTSTEIKFIGSGTADTLGTFLDDVSVIKVPKPVVTVILTKEIDNSADPDNSLVINNPEDFDITLYVAPLEEDPPTVGNPVPGTQLGEDNPNILQNGGLFRISENAPNYIATIEGSGCPEVSTDPSTFSVETEPEEIVPGETVTCHIKNTFVPPPQLTLKKALTNDNGGDAAPRDFVVKFWDENGPDGGNLVKQVRFDSTTSSVVVSDLSPGDYVITEELLLAGPDEMYDTSDDVLDTTSYTTVLIAGDTLCPSMENEVFELEIGNNITCTIYNDDNFVEGEVEEGVSFGHKGFQFSTNNDLYVTTNALGTDPEYSGPRSCETGSFTDSCMETIDPSGSGVFVHLVVDSALKDPQKTLVLWSMTSVMTNQVVTGSCVLVGIFDSETLVKNDPDGIPDNGDEEFYKGFGLYCGDATPIDWNINYAFIETEFETTT